MHAPGLENRRAGYQGHVTARRRFEGLRSSAGGKVRAMRGAAAPRSELAGCKWPEVHEKEIYGQFAYMSCTPFPLVVFLCVATLG